MLALVCLVAFLTAVGIRVYCGFTLMYKYKPDDYLATPRARRMWYAAQLMAPVATIPLIVAATIPQIWWVTMWVCILAVLICCKTAWVMWMRFSGRYRAFYGPTTS